MINIPGYSDPTDSREFTLEPINELERKAKELLGVDHIRVEDYVDKIFVIMGTNKRTQDNQDAYWVDENGNRKDWDYVEWQVMASGETVDEAWKSVQEYKRLCGMTMLDYLNEQLAKSGHEPLCAVT